MDETDFCRVVEGSGLLPGSGDGGGGDTRSLFAAVSRAPPGTGATIGFDQFMRALGA